MYHDDILKLIVAAVLGIFLGLEREIKRKPLGLKTCLVISVTSCLLTIVSMDVSLTANTVGGVVRSDPMRLAAQIVSGIGFLGAGVILHKNNEVIRGLTTAAIVWASSGLGIAVGAGFFFDAIAGLLLIIISVELVPFLTRKFGPQALSEKEVEVRLVVHGSASIREILEQVKIVDRHFEKIQTRDLKGEHKEITVVCVVDLSSSLVDLYGDFERIDGVVSISAEQL